ncbi:MAG TPA: hypothetical protein PKY50_06045 [Candidatus Competibacter sp.]|nr:hypothetical protein [Candidatus Competibacter sp.]
MHKIAIGFVLMWLSIAAFGQVYKCQTQEGAIKFQQSPCAGGVEIKISPLSEARRLEAEADDIERRAQELTDISIKMMAEGIIRTDTAKIAREQYKMQKIAEELRNKAKSIRAQDSLK